MQIDNIEILKDIFSEVLLCPKEALDLNTAYVDLGVDSILAIQIAKLIKLKLGIDIRHSDLYNFISINELSAYVTARVDTKVYNPEIRNETETKCSVTTAETETGKGDDKVAIIGIAGRFPGASNVHQYWTHLLQGKCMVTQTNRWEKEHPNDSYRGGFLSKIAHFDADFFNISPREAALMDPQQRLLMEIVWEALEDAGLPFTQLSQARCGIFTTSLPGDYKYHIQHTAALYHNFSFLGNAVSVLSGRIAHFFNLKGIALHVDTACSSSLVAIDLAIQYLQAQSCDIAIVGASAIFSTPELFKLAKASNLLSSSGLCHTFDAQADGFVPAETVACLVLRRLSDANKMQQPIYGIIEGSHVNHDGYTNGLMSPNSNAQKELIIAGYKKYHIDPLQIGYVEAHGTGTSIGDPIEVKALRESFEKLNAAYRCFLGSCKTNIGHPLVASGLASLIKILMIFKYEIIPPHLHYNTLNPQIDLGNFSINTTPQRWFPDKKLAVVSAFGFSGTNAHIILRKPELRPSYTIAIPHLFLFSAKNKKQLIYVLQSYIVFLEEKRDQDLANISYSLVCTRNRLEEKFIAIAETVAALINTIRDFLNQCPSTVQQHTVHIPEPLEPIKTQFQEDAMYLLPTRKRYQLLEAVAYYLQQDATLELSFLYNNCYYKVPLPSYPFGSKIFWINTAAPASLDTLNQQTNQTPAYKSDQQIIKDSKMLMLNQIKEKLALLLHYNVTDIAEDKSLTYYGVDSIVILQLLDALALGSMDTAILFNSKNIDELATYLAACKQNNNNTTLPLPVPSSSVLQALHPHSLVDHGIEWHIFGKQQGDSLLLLPPLNTLASVWIQQLRFFLRAKQYSIYIPHYPGHGQSLCKRYSVETLAQSIVDSFYTIRSYTTPIDIIGWSLGGCLAMQISSLLPYKVNKMVLVNTAARFKADLFSESMALREELALYADYLSYLYKQQQNSSVAYISAGCSLELLQHYYSSLQQFNIIPQLRTLTPRCLIVHGKKDPVIQQSDIAILQAIPHSSTKHFDNEGHFIPLTAPFIFNKIAYAFLNQSTEGMDAGSKQ